MDQQIDGPDPDKVADAVAHAMMINDQAAAGAGIRVLHTRPGDSVVEMTVVDRQVNGHDSCHGGILFLLADTAFGICCNSHGPQAVAAGCDIVFVRAAMIGDVLQAHATERVLSGRSGVYDVTITREGGAGREIVAEFRGRSRTVGASQPGSDGVRIA